MIDIIIPAYNAHATIEQTLHSLSMQVNRENLRIIIVNDGGNDYQDIIKIFSHWLNIKEITCPKNYGPGFARNYGLEHSNSEYVMFMDADDTLTYSYSLLSMENIISNTDANVLIAKIIEVEKINTNDYSIVEISQNMMWLFGHIYKRSFLDKYNIRFMTTCFNEDVGFNNLCGLFSYYEKEDSGIVLFTGPATYEWRYNENSLSRKQDELYSKQLSIPGYIYNSLLAFERAEKYQIPQEQYLWALMTTLFNIYIQYNLILAQECEPLILNTMIELSRQFYYKYYNLVIESTSIEFFMDSLQEHIKEKQQFEQQYINTDFNTFINSIFSEPAQFNIDYLQLEPQLLELKKK